MFKTAFRKSPCGFFRIGRLGGRARAKPLPGADSGGMVGLMRILFASLLVFCLTACATAPPGSGPSAPSAPAAATAPSSEAMRLLAAAGGPDAPTVQQIERGFGAADIRRQDGAGAALTYRLQSCALLLLFTADDRNTLRLAAAHPSARESGAAAPSLEQCAAETRARRS